MDEYGVSAIRHSGRYSLVDYKFFCIGKQVLWCWMTFRDFLRGVDMKASVDLDYNVLDPTFDPEVCARLQLRDRFFDFELGRKQDALPPKPSAWDALVRTAARDGEGLNVFARVDLYADVERGPLVGEITLFPTMGHPPNLNMQWTNDLVRRVWRDPDGCGPVEESVAPRIAPRKVETETLLGVVKGSCMIYPSSVDAGDLSLALSAFDLSSYGVSPGTRVGLLLPNGPVMAACLLAAISSYVAVPVSPSLPCNALVKLFEVASAKCLITSNGNDSSKLAAHALGMPLIVLQSANKPFESLAVDGRKPMSGSTVAPSRHPNGLDDDVLILHTSGTTGASKRVVSSLGRLLASGEALAFW